MHLPLVRLCVATILFPCLTAGMLSASPTVSVTVNAPRSGSKLRAADGSVSVFRPLSDVASKGQEHPVPILPMNAAAGNFRNEVGLVVETGNSGGVMKVTVDHSSGSPLLDEYAQAWVRYIWRYPAAERIEKHLEQFRFKATHDDALMAKAVHDSSYPDTPRPTYPGLAIYKEWQGTVLMNLTSDEAGKVGRAAVVKSSGSRLLDLWAQHWCEAYWKLPKSAATDCSVTFRLP